jgi:hypothetical protein
MQVLATYMHSKKSAELRSSYSMQLSTDLRSRPMMPQITTIAPGMHHQEIYEFMTIDIGDQ